MIYLICGASHTGKTLLAQKLLERLKMPYLSIDHLKMGLICSGQTALTPSDDDQLTPYLWSIVKEMIKTAIENEQDLIVEGCYIPFDWEKDFSDAYKKEIRYLCLVLGEAYIKAHFNDVKRYACAIEKRLDDSCLTERSVLVENAEFRSGCQNSGLSYYEIEENYDIEKIVHAILAL